MILIVGNETLGDTAPALANGSVGGLGGATDIVVQRAPQAARERLIVRGSPSASLTIPTTRLFGNATAAEEWWLGKVQTGYIAGNVTIRSQGNANTTWDYGVATIAGSKVQGSRVDVSWKLTLGAQLT